MIPFRRLLPAAVLLLSAQACVVSMDDLAPKTDAECWQLEGFDTKACGPKCVSIYAAATGCGEAGCSPCDVSWIPNAAPACDSAGACSYACVAGWDDCVNGSVDGCETFVAGSDPANCGACGRSCDCDRGVCVPALEAVTSATPTGIVVQSGNVYYADTSGAINLLSSGSSVDIIPDYRPGPLFELVPGTSPTSLWASGTMDIVPDAFHPYGWTLALYRVSLAASPATLIAFDAYPPLTSSPDVSYIDGLAVSPWGTVAFTDSDYADVGYLSGLGTDWLYLPQARSGRARGVVWHEGYFYFGYSDAGGTLSWAEDLTEELGSEVVMATGAGTPSRLAVYDDGSSYPLLFWASEDDGGVRVMELNGGVPEVFVVQPPTGPTSRMSITADVDGVYWSNRDLGLVSGWSAWDGRVLDLGYSTSPWALATLGGNVVWTDDFEGAVYSAPK